MTVILQGPNYRILPMRGTYRGWHGTPSVTRIPYQETYKGNKPHVFGHQNTFNYNYGQKDI